MCIGLLLAAACAAAEQNQLSDEIPPDLRPIIQQGPGIDKVLDCILFPGTPRGDTCLVLYPWNLNVFLYTDGAWKRRLQVHPMRQGTDMRLCFRRHAAGAAPGIQGACGLSYPDGVGFDIIQYNTGNPDEIVQMMQFHWAEDSFRLVGWQDTSSGQFALWEDGRWAYFDVATGERLGGARIDRIAEFGLSAVFEDLPPTLEEARKMEAITRVTAETLFPGWTLRYYGEYNMAHGASAGYYRIDNGMLTIRRVELDSKAAGIKIQTDTMSVPLSDALLLRLQTEDMNTLVYIDGETTTFYTDAAFDRDRIPVTDTILQSELQSHGLLLLTEDADGVRRIRLVEQAGDGYSVRSSKPLPGDAWLDLFHSVDDEVSLNWNAHHGSCSFSRSSDGNWTLGWVANEHGFVGLHGTLYCGIQRDLAMHGTESILVGSHPWRDMFTVDFASLPQNVEEATASLDRTGWAVVNNPDLADRLHLRAEPDSDAESLGKFYNRTPVQVLERRDGWARVRIGLDGRLEGWMMEKFLAFGSDMDAVESAAPELTLKDGINIQPLYAFPDLRETTDVPYGLDTWIVGVIGDELFILLDSDGNTGYLPQSLLYPGNG